MWKGYLVLSSARRISLLGMRGRTYVYRKARKVRGNDSPVLKNRGRSFPKTVEQRRIAQTVKNILNEYGIKLYGCTQPHLADIIQPSKCIDGDYYASVTGFDFDTEKDPSQRKACGCTKSIDIGQYRHCPHGCLYCYNKHT